VASSKKGRRDSQQQRREEEAKKLASIKCRVDRGEVTRSAAERFLEKAKKENKREAARSVDATKKCVKRTPKTPKDAVVDAAALGPSDPKDIVSDPMKYETRRNPHQLRRVRHKLTPEEKKKNAKKPKDSVFIARNAAANPAKQAAVGRGFHVEARPEIHGRRHVPGRRHE
jgi:hypothetical protein